MSKLLTCEHGTPRGVSCIDCEQPPQLKKFVLHWVHYQAQEVTGRDIADACNRAGIGNGAIRALDYYEEVK
jgi:hypothetical protein